MAITSGGGSPAWVGVAQALAGVLQAFAALGGIWFAWLTVREYARSRDATLAESTRIALVTLHHLRQLGYRARMAVLTRGPRTWEELPRLVEELKDIPTHQLHSALAVEAKAALIVAIEDAQVSNHDGLDAIEEAQQFIEDAIAELREKTGKSKG